MQAIQNEILKHLPTGDEARRLFHGRGQCFPDFEDLVIDYYPPVVMVILYRQRSQKWLEELLLLLNRTLTTKSLTILLQDRFLLSSPSRILQGALPESLLAREGELSFRLRLGEAQNIGFFPDMAVGRKLISERAEGKRVLNLFSYSCSFSVAALHGGAKQVVNLDMNRGALELGKLNHQINGIDLRKASFMPLELFRSLSKLRKIGPFDLIICDPPASQGKSFSAAKHWPKLIRSLPGLATARAEVLACLNAPDLGPDFLDQLFSGLIPSAEKIGHLTPGDDFPESHPERGVSLHHYLLP